MTDEQRTRCASPHAACAQYKFCADHYMDDTVPACRSMPLNSVMDTQTHRTCSLNGFCGDFYIGRTEKPCRLALER